MKVELKLRIKQWYSLVILLGGRPKGNEMGMMRKYLHSCVHRGSLHSNQDMELPKWPSTDERNVNVVHMHSRILFSHTKE